MKRLTESELKKKITPAETSQQILNRETSIEPQTVFLPTFQFLLKSIEPKFQQLELETGIKNKDIQRRLRKSIGDLPTVLEPVLQVISSPATVAQARILFLEYAIKNDLENEMADSRKLRRKTNLSKMKLRTSIYGWYDTQLKFYRNVKKSGLYSQIDFDEKIQQILDRGNTTIGQLLIMDPNLFYLIPEFKAV